MGNLFSRILWILSGVLLIVCGIVCMVNPGITMSTLSMFLGIAVLISGIIDIAVYMSTKDVIAGASWVLTDGIITAIVALTLLLNNSFVALAIPVILGIWLLFSGISRTISSIDLKQLGVPGWGWFTFFGILLIIFGILSFIKPIVAAFTISMLIGIPLIVLGIVVLIKGFMANRFYL